MMNVITVNGVVKVLENGVEVMDVQIENDIDMAQEILDHSDYATNIDAYSAYNEREYKHYEGTYKFKIKRRKEYVRFLSMLEDTKCYRGEKKDAIINLYNMDVIQWDDAIGQIKDLENCKCSTCNMQKPTFEDWRTNSIEVEEFNSYIGTYVKRQYKLGKYMKKCNISQEVIDFYSTQIKEEKDMFLTITSVAQFVAGMSFFAEIGSWDGAGGTSCQDTRRTDDYCMRLAGALHDDKLHVGFLHEKLSDLEDMEDKMLARVIMRPVEVNGEIVLVPTKYYGNNTTKDQLHKALEQLAEVGIYSVDIVNREYEEDKTSWITMDTSGGYEMTVIEDHNHEETIDEYVSCDCPACDGDGTMTREFTLHNGSDVDFEFECPMCQGSGTFEVNVYEEIDTTVEVEATTTITPYHENEGSHYSYDEYDGSYQMRINVDKVKRDMDRYAK